MTWWALTDISLSLSLSLQLLSSPQRPLTESLQSFMALTWSHCFFNILPFVHTGLCVVTSSQVEDGFCFQRTCLSSLCPPSVSFIQATWDLHLNFMEKSRFYRLQETGILWCKTSVSDHYWVINHITQLLICMKWLWSSDFRYSASNDLKPQSTWVKHGLR